MSKSIILAPPRPTTFRTALFRSGALPKFSQVSSAFPLTSRRSKLSAALHQTYLAVQRTHRQAWSTRGVLLVECCAGCSIAVDVGGS